MMSRKGERHLWRCMLLYLAFLIVLCIVAVACSERKVAVPRPTAYPRVMRAYDTTYTCVFPALNIMLNKNAVVSDSDGGFSVRYAKYGASLYCSYEGFSCDEDFMKTMDKRIERVALDSGSHKPDIYRYNNPDGGYSAKVFYTEENCVTPVHFIATDSLTYIVSGAVVLDNVENYDSIAPIINYLNDDVSYLVKHLKFNSRKINGN